jgi:hypothetical protein
VPWIRKRSPLYAAREDLVVLRAAINFRRDGGALREDRKRRVA